MTLIQKNLKYFLLATALISAISFTPVLNHVQAQSDDAGNVSGWLWGGSTNDINPGCANPNGSVDCGNLGWTSLSSDNSYDNKEPGQTYGITIQDVDGPVTGLVWNSNVGWIDFAPSGGYPTSGCNPACPTTGVTRVGDVLDGWARIQSIQDAVLVSNAGGWEGWIKMSGVAKDGNSYGVKINSASGAISGLAWSNEFGWIDFNAKITPPVIPPNDPNPDPDPDPDPDQDQDQNPLPPPPPDFGLDVTCSGFPNPAYLTNGGIINWTASVISPGVLPYSYAWTFSPQPDIATGNYSVKKATYSIAGGKSASIIVTDAGGATASASCNANVLKTNKLKEIIPFLPFNYNGSRNV